MASAGSMSTVVAPTMALGFQGDVADPVCFLDEQNVIYPMGATAVLYNVEQKSQRFILRSGGTTSTSAMAVSPNRRYVALAEEGERASVTVYDLHSLKKRKVRAVVKAWFRVQALLSVWSPFFI